MDTIRTLAAMVGIGLCTAALQAGEFDFQPTAVDPGMMAFLQDAAPNGQRRADAREIAPYVIGASDFNGNTLVAGGAGIDWFIANGLSVGLFAEGMHVNQDGDNAIGIGGGVLMRWHFIETKSLSVFTELGVGYTIFDQPVPSDGVQGDFTPRAAIGMNLALDATTSLSMQAGWLHLSNAQTGENNPAIDALAIGLGLHFEF